MKILHTSDWHLGKRLDNFSRHPEQIEVLDEISQIADNEHVDMVLIAGDIFDTFNPPVESIELFYKTVKRLCNGGKRPVVVIAGNHDSPDRIEAPDALALEDAILFAGYPDVQIRTFKNAAGVELTKSEKGFIEISLPGIPFPVRIILSPYANQFRLRKFLGVENEEQELRSILQEKWKQLSADYFDENGVNLFCGHLYFVEENSQFPDEPDDEKPILHIGGSQAIYTANLPQKLQYAALGHLHRNQKISENPIPVVYCGSPLSYSFSEAGQTKFVEIVELEPAQQAKLQSVPLTKGKALSRQRFESVDDAVDWLKANQDKLVELTMVSDEYLSAIDRKRLNDSHENIIGIIPESRLKSSSNNEKALILPDKGMKELFSDYFQAKHNQNPNDKILELFNEILSAENSDSDNVQ